MYCNCLLDWLDVVLEPTVIILLAVIGYWQGHKAWRKQKAEEIDFNREQKKMELDFQELQNNAEIDARFKEKKFQNCIEAHRAAWALIVYFSENDNDLNMIRRGEIDANGDKIYYFRKEQAKKYFKALQQTFYTDGHGFFLSKEVKQLLYEMRSRMYGLYHIANKNDVEEMQIEKKEVSKRIQQIRDELILKLKAEIDKY